VVLVLAQILLIGESFYRLKDYWSGISVLLNLLSAVLVIYIVNRDQNPAFKLTWVIPICAFPMLGALLYFWVETNIPTKGIKQEVSKRVAETKPYQKQDERIRRQLNELSCSMTSVSRYAEAVGNYPTFQNTGLTYFGLGEDAYQDMLVELEKAEKYIFLEYFIISEGMMWNSILKILKKKIAEGVEVKLLYDGVCALYYLPSGYQKKMIAEGVDTRVFVPVIPIFSTHQNNRDHRKIMVIDGKTAYTGGINLADEYINHKSRLGHWKDNALKLQGDAVKTFTLMFLQMWNVSNPENNNGYIPGEYLKYLPKTQDEEKEQRRYPNGGYIMPYGDGPNSVHNLAENVYLDMINRSNKYIHIMSPYFIVDHEMLTSLTYAAQRGNDVRMILPHIPDKKITYDVARTFYPFLLAAGVKIYEYTPGFIHAKTVVSDDNKAAVGSINMDFRSLYHHYECGVYLYLDPAVQEIEADFQKTMMCSQEVTLEYYRAIPWYKRLVGYIIKLFAPLL
jgi:cardiolipin synthase